jgi:hypothetical protein
MKLLSAAALAVWTLASAFGQTPVVPRATNPEGAYQQSGKVPARILEFSIEPASIKPGQTVNLRWAVENPASTDIDPGIGPVKPKDVRQLSPAATTTYTLSVRGPNGLLTKSVTVTVAGTKPLEPVPVQAEAGPRKTPRMPDGKPNLTGVTTRVLLCSLAVSQAECAIRSLPSSRSRPHRNSLRIPSPVS